MLGDCGDGFAVFVWGAGSDGRAILGERCARANGTRVVIDDVGRRVLMPAQVNRIVTLAPNLTETVYALGLGDKLVGDTDVCDTPPAAKQKPHVGDPQDPSLEAIVALRPDLVLATTSINREETADALARLGIAVYTTAGDTQTMLEMLDSMAKMGDLMGAGPQGAAFVARLAGAARCAARAARRTADGARALCGLAGPADHDWAEDVHRGCAALG